MGTDSSKIRDTGSKKSVNISQSADAEELKLNDYTTNFRTKKQMQDRMKDDISDGPLSLFWLFYGAKINGPRTAHEIYSAFMRDEINLNKTKFKRYESKNKDWFSAQSIEIEAPYLHKLLEIAVEKKSKHSIPTAPAMKLSIIGKWTRYIGIIVSKILIIITILHLIVPLLILTVLGLAVNLLLLCCCGPCICCGLRDLCRKQEELRGTRDDCCYRIFGMNAAECWNFFIIGAVTSLLISPIAIAFAFAHDLLFVPINEDKNKDEMDESLIVGQQAVHIMIGIGFISTPICLLFVMFQFQIFMEYKEIRPLLLAYMVWSQYFWIDFISGTKSSWYRDIQWYILGVNVKGKKRNDILIGLSALTSMFPALIAGYVMKFILDGKFELDFNQDIAGIMKAFYIFGQDVAKSTLAAFAIIRALSWLRVKADYQMSTVATKKTR